MEIKAEKLVEEARELISPVITKPDYCPFCGGHASLISEYDVESDQSFYYVYCTKCGVEQGYYSKTQEEAIEKWNRRTNGKKGGQK